MFRISKADERLRTVVTIEGELSGDHIEVVETCCEQAAENGKPLYLFLRDVSTVDPGGHALLLRLVAKGVHLLGAGVYTSYLVRSLNRLASKAPTPVGIAARLSKPAVSDR